ncbi:MAG: AEC family transporter [Paracoccaceae bacterium]
MLVVIEAIIPVFTIVMLGFILRKIGFIATEFWGAVEDLCFYIFFPALLAKTMILADLAAVDASGFTLTILISTALIGAAMLALWPVLRSTIGTLPGQFTTIYQTTTRWHGFIALAIVLNLYGDQGAALIAIVFAVMIPVLQVSNILVLSAFSPTARPSIVRIAKTIVQNPIIWGITIGLAVNFSQITLWSPVLSTLDLLGRAALGAALLVLGAGLSIKAALNPSRELLIGVIGKLLFTPLVMMSVGYLFGLKGLERDVLLICAAVPTAMNGYVLARKMGGDAPLYATISTVQTVFSFLTIPLLIWLVS